MGGKDEGGKDEGWVGEGWSGSLCHTAFLNMNKFPNPVRPLPQSTPPVHTWPRARSG